jgi:quercetin dioxygenase-like cupin family protein
MGAIGWQPGEGETIQNPVGGPLTFKVRAKQTNGALTVVETTAPPGEGPPLHVHANEDEALYTLDGTLRFRMGDDVQRAPAGAFRIRS